MTDITEASGPSAALKAQLAADGVFLRAQGFAEKLKAAGGLEAFNTSQWYRCDDGGERWYSPGENATRDQAVAAAIEAGNETIGLGTKGLTRFSLDAPDLIDRALEDGLEEEVGEDGQHGLDDVSLEAVAELQVMLDAAVTAWVIRHKVEAFNFVETREERIDGGGNV